MSLEQAIATQTAAIMANTDAVNALLAALANGTAPIGATTQPTVEAKTRKPKGEKTAEVPSSSMFDKTAETGNDGTAPIAETQSTTTTEGATSSATEEKVTREMLTKAVLDVVKVNRQAAVDILAEFGAKKAPELKDDQVAPAFAKLQAVLDSVG